MCWWCVRDLVPHQHVILFDNTRVQLHLWSWQLLWGGVPTSIYLAMHPCASVWNAMCYHTIVCIPVSQNAPMCAPHQPIKCKEGPFVETYTVHLSPKRQFIVKQPSSVVWVGYQQSLWWHCGWCLPMLCQIWRSIADLNGTWQSVLYPFPLLWPNQRDLNGLPTTETFAYSTCKHQATLLCYGSHMAWMISLLCCQCEESLLTLHFYL